jgi:hypothetical protein
VQVFGRTPAVVLVGGDDHTIDRQTYGATSHQCDVKLKRPPVCQYQQHLSSQPKTFENHSPQQNQTKSAADSSKKAAFWWII